MLSKFESYILFVIFFITVSSLMAFKNNALQDSNTAKCESVGGKLSYVWDRDKRETVCAKLNILYRVK